MQNKNANDVSKNCLAIGIAVGAEAELSRSSVRATVRAQSELTFYDTFIEMRKKEHSSDKKNSFCACT